MAANPKKLKIVGNGKATRKAAGAGASSQTKEAFTDLAAYPILTEEVGFPPSPLAGGAAPAPAGAAQLGQVAMKAVADVLGWKVKTDDPKGFLGALTQAFTLTEIEGHVKATWVPRTYAVQSDLSGGISGAQASLYDRAQDALGNSLPLLDGLYALDPVATPEDLSALREVVRGQLNQLVTELGYSGGPRVSRVNQYFGLLLGSTFSPLSTTLQPDPDQVAGTLGNLRDYYSLYTLKGGSPNPFINTVDDEQDATNFRILSDYITSLAQSWLNNMKFFGLATAQPFFGTQLVLISRQLSVTSELVDEVRFALDSVFIGPSERQTLEIDFSSGDSLFLEDFLSWIKSFVTDEAPGVIQNGGKFGVYQVVQVAQKLLTIISSRPTNSDIPAGYFTPRVQRALLDLSDQLQELVTIAQRVGTATLGAVPSLNVGP